MYAIAVVRYRKPLEQVLEVVDDHRAYLQDLKRKGWLLASGPLDPRNGRRSLRGDGDGAVRDLAVAAEHRQAGSRSALSAVPRDQPAAGRAPSRRRTSFMIA